MESTVRMRLVSSRRMSRKSCSILAMSGMSPDREVKVATRSSAPSSRRTLFWMRLARNSRISSDTFMPARSRLLRRISSRALSSGRFNSTVSPDSRRAASRGSRLEISHAAASAQITMVLWAWNSSSNVCRNSSTVFSLPEINCTSSTSRTSALRYLRRSLVKLCPFWVREASINSLANCSPVTYTTLVDES